jgi:hypothetical protein
MADAPVHRPSGARIGPDAERDARIEQLLLDGLDEYFAGRYEQAIHVWTRVLFLDRGHARARAYIERARRALAERQRESEELFHRGADAFERGDARAARRLLSTAIARGAAEADALALLGRLDRLEAAAGTPATAPPASRAGTRRVPPEERAPRAAESVWGSVGPLMGLLVGSTLLWAGVWLVLDRVDQGRWAVFDAFQRREAAPAAPAPLPVPTAAEAALARARELVGPRSLDEPGGVSPEEAAGLQEALRVLEAIRPGDPLRPEADALQAKIQRALLAGVGAEAPGRWPTPPDLPR